MVVIYFILIYGSYIEHILCYNILLHYHEFTTKLNIYKQVEHIELWDDWV